MIRARKGTILLEPVPERLGSDKVQIIVPESDVDMERKRRGLLHAKIVSIGENDHGLINGNEVMIDFYSAREIELDGRKLFLIFHDALLAEVVH